jgi:hypothetical protein
MKRFTTPFGFASIATAVIPANAARLWDVSLKLITAA